jgi:hypothetical protein
MLWLLSAFAVCDVPTYTRINASSFLDLIWRSNGDSSANVPADAYSHDNGTFFVVRAPGDTNTGSNYTFYYVAGTPQEIAAVKAVLPAPVVNLTIENATAAGAKVYFVLFANEPSFNQLSTFWVSLVVVILGLVFAIGSIVIWGTDNYAKDPANSLLFVTDGNRIVTGE